MQNTMLDSTVSSDSQELFFGFNFVVLVLMIVHQMWYGRKKKRMDWTSYPLRWSFRMVLNDVSSTALTEGGKP